MLGQQCSCSYSVCLAVPTSSYQTSAGSSWMEWQTYSSKRPTQSIVLLQLTILRRMHGLTERFNQTLSHCLISRINEAQKGLGWNAWPNIVQLSCQQASIDQILPIFPDVCHLWKFLSCSCYIVFCHLWKFLSCSLAVTLFFVICGSFWVVAVTLFFVICGSSWVVAVY